MERGCRSERWTCGSEAEGVRLFRQKSRWFGAISQDSRDQELQLMPRSHRTWGSLGLMIDLMMAMVSRIVPDSICVLDTWWKQAWRERRLKAGWPVRETSLWGHLQNHPWLWFPRRAPQTVISVSLVPTWGLRSGAETLVKDITPCLAGAFSIVELLCVCECVHWGGNNYKRSKK